jgi:hypothetical protein
MRKQDYTWYPWKPPAELWGSADLGVNSTEQRHHCRISQYKSCWYIYIYIHTYIKVPHCHLRLAPRWYKITVFWDVTRCSLLGTSVSEEPAVSIFTVNDCCSFDGDSRFLRNNICVTNNVASHPRRAKCRYVFIQVFATTSYEKIVTSEAYCLDEYSLLYVFGIITEYPLKLFLLRRRNDDVWCNI